MNQPTTALQDQQNITARIKANDRSLLKKIYKENLYKVESYVMKNSGTAEVAKDIFQEAFLVVWTNIKDDKFKPATLSELNAYLFTVAKNKWLNQLRSSTHKLKVITDKVDYWKEKNSEENSAYDVLENDEKLNALMDAFNKLGESCRSLLSKFYFEKKSMEEMALELNLNSASVRNKKYRCMQMLRSKVTID